MGRVAEEAKDWAEAERYHKEGLAIDERIGDKESVAKTCNQLAIVAKGAGRPDEAERWYMRAIELGEELGDRQGLAKRLNNLADLYLSQGRLDEAERYAHRAREIKETLDLSSKPWTTYSILAQIVDKRGRAEEGRQWRRKEQETRMAFEARSGGQASTGSADTARHVAQWEPHIQAVVAICNGDTQAAQQLEPFLQKMEQTDDWRNLIPVIRRILAGERGIELTEGLDAVDAAIVRRILGLLQEPPPEPSLVPQKARDRGGSDDSLPPPSGGRAGDGGEGSTLQDLLNLVIAGARGDAQAGGQAYQIAQALQQPEQPPEIRQLGRGLQRVLEGLRGEEVVQGLPEEAAEAIRLVLQNI